MHLVSFIYRGLYDSLATLDVSGGVLLVAIWFQTGYVALFRAIHGDDAGHVASPTPAPRSGPPAHTPSPASPWGAR